MLCSNVSVKKINTQVIFNAFDNVIYQEC